MDDGLITAVAAAAGTALVKSMTSDAWTSIRARIVDLLGRGHRANQRDAAQSLEKSRQQLLTAKPEEQQQVATFQEAMWAGRLESVLSYEPDLISKLRDIIAEINHTLKDDTANHAVTQVIISGCDAYTAGRDQHFRIDRRSSDDNIDD